MPLGLIWSLVLVTLVVSSCERNLTCFSYFILPSSNLFIIQDQSPYTFFRSTSAEAIVLKWELISIWFFPNFLSLKCWPVRTLIVIWSMVVLRIVCRMFNCTKHYLYMATLYVMLWFLTWKCETQDKKKGRSKARFFSYHYIFFSFCYLSIFLVHLLPWVKKWMISLLVFIWYK